MPGTDQVVELHLHRIARMDSLGDTLDERQVMLGDASSQIRIVRPCILPPHRPLKTFHELRHRPSDGSISFWSDQDAQNLRRGGRDYDKQSVSPGALALIGGNR